jgi:hypothetical protein
MNGWIGVDLDGTLAEYDGWKGKNHIGNPVKLMVDRVKQWISKGKEVRIFTARVFQYDPDQEDVIQKWCLKHIGSILPITCFKDYGMIELWDDRAVQVVPNKGIALQEIIKSMANHSQKENEV